VKFILHQFDVFGNNIGFCSYEKGWDFWEGGGGDLMALVFNG